MSQPHLPRLPAALLRALLPRAERDEVLADLATEYGGRTADEGPAAARRWLWRQALGSAPALLGWGWWREWTGFEPRANAYRPGGSMLKSWIADVHYATRRLLARPTYALLAILTLTLGVGGTASVYGIARRLLFDPLPYARERELVVFWQPYSWTEEEFLYFRGRFPGYQSATAYRPNDVTLKQGDAPARLVPGMASTAELFDVLGARPLIGRGFRAGDDTPGAEPVAVLSWGLWRELGGDRAIVGRRLMLDGQPRTVVGVMPRGFWFPNPSIRIWTPTPLSSDNRSGNYTIVGRVAPGQDARTMTAPLARLTKMLGERFEYPEKWDKTKNAFVTPIRDDLMGAMRPAVLATLGAMGLILLIACANVAALMLGQVDARSAELAVRSALGANRRRLTQQLVVEALLIGGIAAAFGAGIAVGGYRLLARALPLGAWAETATPDWRVFAWALGIALVAAVLVVVVPTVSLWRGDLRGVMGRARTGGLEGRGGRLENGLVVAEVALAVLIASGAALLVRSVNNLYKVDPGLDPKGVALVTIVPAVEMRSRDEWRSVQDILAALRGLPGVRSTAAVHRLPLRAGGDNWGVVIEGQDPGQGSTTYVRGVTMDYFATMGMTLKSGRLYDASDRALGDSVQERFAAGDTVAPERAVVVNEALARKYFPGEDPLGKRLAGGVRGWQRIIGVVGNVAEGKLTDPAEPARYYLVDQAPIGTAHLAVVMRMAPGGDPVTVLDAARRTVERTAPNFAVEETTTMQRVFDDAVGPARQVMALLSLLTALALTLGAVGIYGVIAHFAARRQRDWAIRVALGLPSSRVVSHVVGHGAVLMAGGIVVGVVAAAGLARLISSLLFGVSALDPLAFAAAGLALLVVGLLAAFVPARRAGMTDPAIALREQ